VVLDEFWRVVPVARRLIFFGFGFKDIDLLYSFRRRQRALENIQGNPRQFAVMPLHDPAQENVITIRMRMEYGIEPIFFFHRPHGSFVESDPANRHRLRDKPESLTSVLRVYRRSSSGTEVGAARNENLDRTCLVDEWANDQIMSMEEVG
jgi:hypothetical protein